MSRGEHTCKESLCRSFPRALGVSSLAIGHTPGRAFPSAPRSPSSSEGPLSVLSPFPVFSARLPWERRAMWQAAAGGLCCCVGFGSCGTKGWDTVVWVNLLLLFDLKTNLSLRE